MPPTTTASASPTDHQPPVDSAYREATPHTFNPLEFAAKKIREQVMDAFADIKPKIADIKTDIKTGAESLKNRVKQDVSSKIFGSSGNSD